MDFLSMRSIPDLSEATSNLKIIVGIGKTGKQSYHENHPMNMKMTKRSFLTFFFSFLPLIGLTQIPDGPI